MSEILSSQFLIFIYSSFLGVGLGFLYDLFRIVRMLINPHFIGMFVQDVIYFIASGLITFLFVLGFNMGEARLYIVAGEGIGWIIYHITVGNIIYKYSNKTVDYIAKMLNILKLKIKNKSNFLKKH